MVKGHKVITFAPKGVDSYFILTKVLQNLKK